MGSSQGSMKAGLVLPCQTKKTTNLWTWLCRAGTRQSLPEMVGGALLSKISVYAVALSFPLFGIRRTKYFCP